MAGFVLLTDQTGWKTWREQTLKDRSRELGTEAEIAGNEEPKQYPCLVSVFWVGPKLVPCFVYHADAARLVECVNNLGKVTTVLTRPQPDSA